MICMHNCTDCKRKLSESGMQRVHVTSCNIRPSSTLARPLAQIYLCRDPNNTASRNTIALVHRSQLLEFRTGWPLWTCMSIRGCRSVRRNPVTITIAPRGTSTGKPPTPCTRRNDQWGQLVLHPCKTLMTPQSNDNDSDNVNDTVGTRSSDAQHSNADLGSVRDAARSCAAEPVRVAAIQL